MDLATVIVNYRAAALVADCLRSLAPERLGPVVVVENASGDDSITRLRSLRARSRVPLSAAARASSLRDASRRYVPVKRAPYPYRLLP